MQHVSQRQESSTCRYVVPRQRQFRADLAVVNECLDELILLAKRTQQPEDIEALQQRDYTKVDTAPIAACTVACLAILPAVGVKALQLRPTQAGGFMHDVLQLHLSCILRLKLHMDSDVWHQHCASQVRDPSLLRFLVDIRDADPSDKQLRDDLMTMLIAGHETTAAVLTWCAHC